MPPLSDSDHDMDAADRVHEAPGLTATDDVPVDNDPRQRVAPTAVMQSPQSRNTSVPPKSLNFGDSCLGKRRATAPPISREESGSTAYPSSPQYLPEPSSENNGGMPTPPAEYTKKRKTTLESEGVEHDSLGHFDDGLFVSQRSLVQRLEMQEEQMRANAPIPPTIARTKYGVKPYSDRVEKTTSGLAVDSLDFDIYCRQASLIVKYLEDEVQRIRTQYGGLQDGEVDAILSKCVQYKQVDRRKQLLNIIFWGPSGHGKSTILRCLLNELDAAFASSSVQGCTNVKHQYLFTETLRNGQYEAVIEFISKTALHSIVEHHVETVLAYKRLKSPGGDDEDPLAPNTDRDEPDVTERDSSLDILAGLTIRPGRGSEIGSRSQLELLVNSEDYKKSAIKEKFVRYANNTFQETVGEGKIVKTAQSLEELRDEYIKYARPTDGQILAPWLLVKQIAIGLPAFVLANSISLADVPGIFDTHQVRRQAANDSFEKCSTVVLVHKYERNETSTQMNDSLRKCVSANKNVIVALTHIEDAAKSDCKFLGDSESKDQLTLGLELKDGILKQQTCELRQIKRELTQAEDEDDSEDGVISPKVRELNAKCTETKARIYKRSIAIKRELIAVSLQKEHEKIQIDFNGRADKTLSVHCTCGPEYETHMKGYHHEDTPELSVQETGVPALRRELRSLRAEMMIQDLEDTINHKGLARVLNALQFYCGRSKLERKKLIEHLVAEPKEQFTFDFDELSEKLVVDFEAIMEFARSQARQTSKTRGRFLHEKWAKLHHSTYRGFCQNFGNHRQKVGKDLKMMHWNLDIADEMRDLVVDTCKEILRTFEISKTEFVERVDGLLNGMIVKLKGTTGMNLESFDARIRAD